jgi:hypothetical protein
MKFLGICKMDKTILVEDEIQLVALYQEQILWFLEIILTAD